MWIFAVMALLFVLGVVRMLVSEPPRVVVAASVLLLAQPFLTLRLVSRLRLVPRWVQAAALTGWALSAVLVVAWPPPLPPPVVWPVVSVFFTVELVAAWLLGGGGAPP
jgi:hypothetical protein